MADDSKIWDRFYDTVYGPITRWPIRSLGFFGLWLALGLWLRAGPGFIQKPEALYISLFTACLIVPSVGIALCLHRILVVHEVPSSLADVSSLDAVKESFVGRDDDVRGLTTLLLNAQQVWLNGDSGVGKSVLLQKALVPELLSKRIEVIYLNFWRGDWEEGPALAVLDKLGQHPSENVLEALQLSLNSFNGVIILDQFDEFQIAHADKLISSSARVISRANLESDNRFFRILNEAIRQRRVRCVFVTRRDVEWAKRPVLFDDAEEFFLGRLRRSVVEAEISRIISEETVRNPDNGWRELRSQMCDDLASDGVLPVQMRFAILGLESLRQKLTTSAYLRAGGLNGLISGYLETEVRRVSGSKSVSKEIFALLDHLVAAEGTSTFPVSETTLFQRIQFEHSDRLRTVFEKLQASDIVRRVLSPTGEVLWRLDHDHLAAAVRRMVRRQLPEQWELQEDCRRFVAAPWWRKAQHLGFPTRILRYFRARLFRGLSLGPAAAWILFSLSAHLFVASCITYFLWSNIDRATNEQQGRDLFDRFDAGAIHTLAHASLPSRQAFLKAGLQSSTNTERLRTNLHELVIALSHLNVQDVRALFDHSIRPSVATLPATSRNKSGWNAICTLINDWGSASLVTQTDADILSSRLVDALIDFNDSDQHVALQQTLEALGERISPANARRMADKLVARISARTRYSYTHPELARALNSVRRKLPKTSTDAYARITVDEMVKRNDKTDVDWDARTFEVLARDVSNEGAKVFADELLVPMNNNDQPRYDTRRAREDSVGRVAGFARAFAAIKGRVTADKVEAAATALVRRMGTTPDPGDLHLLASRLGMLGNGAKVEQIRVATTTLLGRMKMADVDVDGLRELAAGLGDLGNSVDDDSIRTAAAVLTTKMGSNIDSDVFRVLADGLNELGARVSPDIIDAAATMIVDQWRFESSGEIFENLAEGLESLGGKVSSRRADELSAKLISIMLANDPQSYKVARGFRGLGSKVSSDQANVLVATLLPHMPQQPSDYVASQTYYSYASTMASLKNAILSSAQMAAFRGVFEMDQAPCALILVLEPETRQAALERQLFNPACAKNDWNQIVLAVSQIASQSFATGDFLLPSDIKVDFIGLCRYITGRTPWYQRIRLTPPQLAGLVLLVASAAVLTWGLALSSAAKSVFAERPEPIHPR